jgi:hypothetical protein
MQFGTSRPPPSKPNRLSPLKAIAHVSFNATVLEANLLELARANCTSDHPLSQSARVRSGQSASALGKPNKSSSISLPSVWSPYTSSSISHPNGAHTNRDEFRSLVLRTHSKSASISLHKATLNSRQLHPLKYSDRAANA